MIAQLELPACVLPGPPLAVEARGQPWLLFQREVDGYTSRYAAVWEAAEAATPRLGPAITLSEKLENEAQASRYMEELKGRLRRFPRSRDRRRAWRETLLGAGKEAARASLGLTDAGLNLFFTHAGVEATRQFVKAAREFDPGMEDESLFQALRNLWIVHCIQLLLGKEASLSPATFAYSMLYPCTDNYLDDPQVPLAEKLLFGDWLEQRLRGSRAMPAGGHAAQVGRLVGLIEGCLPRAEFEEVYLSLRAIHHAQMSSLAQQQGWESLNERDLLRTTVRKGGASVLADACLVGGRLAEAEADFMFGYGVLLQLMDDLQDAEADLEQEHATLFSRNARAGLLDGAVSRLWSFAQAVLWCSGHFAGPEHRLVKKLIEESCKLLVLQSVACNRRLYSARLAAELEACSRFRFNFIRDHAETLAGEAGKIVSLLRRRRQIESTFDLLD